MWLEINTGYTCVVRVTNIGQEWGTGLGHECNAREMHITLGDSDCQQPALNSP